MRGRRLNKVTTSIPCFDADDAPCGDTMLTLRDAGMRARLACCERDGHVMSVLTGLFLGLLGLVIVGFAANRLLRVARTPTTPIAKSPGGGIAEIKGRALPGPSGTITAPVSGVQALWVRIDVSGTREESNGNGGRSTGFHSSAAWARSSTCTRC